MALEPQPWDVIGQEVDRLLDDLARKHAAENDRDQSYFHPSTIGYCPRKTVMERLGVATFPLEPRKQRIFEMGHGVHERIQRDLKEAGILVLDEVPVRMCDADCHGHTDGLGVVIFAEKGGVPIILEIKSAGAKSFHWIAGGALPGDKKKVYGAHGPDKKHVAQVQLYMYMTGYQYAVIRYECKDCSAAKSFTVKIDRDLIRDVLLPIIYLVNAHVESKTLPPRDRARFPNMDCFDCTYCDYRAVCMVEESSDGAIDLIEVGNRLVTEQLELAKK